ncbi:MAG: hypothetical protein P1U74_00940 [Legionellaceae bacterium]|nr:hypothetical protein [Legionellaceae bacterium]
MTEEQIAHIIKTYSWHQVDVDGQDNRRVYLESRFIIPANIQSYYSKSYIQNSFTEVIGKICPSLLSEYISASINVTIGCSTALGNVSQLGAFSSGYVSSTTVSVDISANLFEYAKQALMLIDTEMSNLSDQMGMQMSLS